MFLGKIFSTSSGWSVQVGVKSCLHSTTCMETQETGGQLSKSEQTDHGTHCKHINVWWPRLHHDMKSMNFLLDVTHTGKIKKTKDKALVVRTEGSL